MDSSFLTGLHISLGLFACLLFFKMIIQFGLPNHPARFVAFMVGLSTLAYFVGLSLCDLGIFSALEWMRWRALPLIVGSLFLLLQTIMLAGNFSFIQQKVISRLPLMAALMCFAFFNELADYFTAGFVLLGALFLIISVKKARHQRRLYLKMSLFFLVYLAMGYEILLFGFIFYAFLFEHSFAVQALVDDFRQSLEGEI